MYVLIGIAAVLAVFIAVAATRPAAYRVERKLEVGAPAERVFAVLDDVRQLAGVYFLFGEPLSKANPTFAAQSCAWSDGTLTVDERIPGQRVGLKLEMVKPMESKATIVLVLSGTATGTLVTWTMAGSHNFVGKAMGVFLNMDKALGGDIERGLAQLKTVAEG